MPQMEQQLFAAVSSTSSWLDGVENNVFSGSVLLAENTETQLQEQEVRLRVRIKKHVMTVEKSLIRVF